MREFTQTILQPRLIKDGVVLNIIVADEAFALNYADNNGLVALLRPNNSVGIGHQHHGGKFWDNDQEIDNGASNSIGTCESENMG